MSKPSKKIYIKSISFICLNCGEDHPVVLYNNRRFMPTKPYYYRYLSKTLTEDELSDIVDEIKLLHAMLTNNQCEYEDDNIQFFVEYFD